MLRIAITCSRYLFLCFLFAACNTAKRIPIDPSAPIEGLLVRDSTLQFIVMGDWGQQGSSGQQEVAARMASASRQLHAGAIITTGDNLYPSGVSDTSDIQWKLSYENVYKDSALQITWFPVLGNHDYQQNADAQIEYTKHSKRWFLPARYHDTTFLIGKDSVLFVFLDTEPMEQLLRKKPADPVRFPERAAIRQREWLEQTLRNSNAKWKIVTGHHPLHTGGARRHSSRPRKLKRWLQPIFLETGVDIYFAGHEHQLEYLHRKKWPTHYVISGAASETRHVGFLKFYRRFAARQMGFVTLSVSDHTLLVQFVGSDGRQLYDFEVVK